MYTYSVASLKKLRTCDVRLQDIMMEAIKHMDITIVCGHRGRIEQDIAFQLGKSQLKWPNSKHNTIPSIAVDVVPYPEAWNDVEKLCYMAGVIKEIARQKGIELRWGGDWDMDYDLKDQNFNDYAHFELVK